MQHTLGKMAVLVSVLLTGCAGFQEGEFLRLKETTMNRAEYNKPLFGEECIFDSNGHKTNEPCKDLRLRSYNDVNRRHVQEILQTSAIPEINMVGYETVSRTEEACFRLTGNYAMGCIDFKTEPYTVHFTFGDNAVLQHESAHAIAGHFH